MTTIKLITYEVITEYDGFIFDATVDIVGKTPVIRKISAHDSCITKYRETPKTLRLIFRDGAKEQIIDFIKSERMVRDYV